MKSAYHPFTHFRYAFNACVLLLAMLLPVIHLHAAPKSVLNADSIRRDSKVREVLTSQQLFVVELSPIKGKHPKNVDVNFKAELRDAFTVICYDGDKTTTEQDWRMCPDGKCPVATTYKFGTPGYKQLDTLMAQTKKIADDFQKRINSLKKVSRKQNR